MSEQEINLPLAAKRHANAIRLLLLWNVALTAAVTGLLIRAFTA